MRKGPFRLSVEDGDDTIDPTWDEISERLRRLRPGHCSFVILSGSDHDFVQTIGEVDRLAIEYQTGRPDGTRAQYVLGRRGKPSIVREYIKGQAIDAEANLVVPVLAHEVLDLTDALVVFDWFLRTGSVPEAYSMRDITEESLSSDVEEEN